MMNLSTSILRAAGVAAATLSLAVAMPAAAQMDIPSGTYALDKGHASVTWKVMHLGLSNYTARFADMDATLELDAAAPEKSTVSVTINPASVRTDYPFTDKEDFDKKLSEGADWFNSTVFPTITFASTKLEQLTPTTGKLTGDLTLLGVTKPVTLDVILNGAKEHPFSKKPSVGVSASGMIKRSDWGFSNAIPMIGDEVQLLIEVEFNKQ